MPIYEYECVPNRHRFEVMQKFSDPPVSHCTVCGEPVQRLISAPAIQFKGTGWYITDYSRKNSPSDSGSGSSGKSSDKSTEKTAASTDTAGKDSAGSKE